MSAGVGLQGSYRGDHDRGIGAYEARGAALDVEEALRAHVGSKAGLGYEEVTAVDADEVGNDRGVAVRDVAERPGVDQDRSVLQGLEQIRA